MVEAQYKLMMALIKNDKLEAPYYQPNDARA